MAGIRSIFARYRLVPLIVVGIVFMVVFFLLALLIWSFIAYQFKIDISEAAVLPAIIYYGGIFLACCLMTSLIKGGTVFPSLILSLLTAIVALFLVDTLTFVGAIERLLLSLLFGVLAFTLTKIYFIWVRDKLSQLRGRKGGRATS